jgi:hypothetical protein
VAESSYDEWVSAWRRTVEVNLLGTANVIYQVASHDRGRPSRGPPTRAHSHCQAIRDQSPFGRVATTQEVALAVMSLAGPQAEWASGSILDFNGASYLH